MTPLVGLFDSSLFRFALSGTLITCYLVADVLARRRGIARRAPRPPRWVHLVVLASVTAFYLLIKPAGGAWGGGVLNLAGIALVLSGCAMRFHQGVRYPELTGRGLLYMGLPLAVGVPWGWLVLSAPACVVSVHCALRADELLAASPGAPLERLPSRRMVPGIW